MSGELESSGEKFASEAYEITARHLEKEFDEWKKKPEAAKVPDDIKADIWNNLKTAQVAGDEPETFEQVVADFVRYDIMTREGIIELLREEQSNLG